MAQHVRRTRRLIDGPGRATHKRRPKKRKERLLHKGNKTRIRIQERLVLILLLVGLNM